MKKKETTKQKNTEAGAEANTKTGTDMKNNNNRKSAFYMEKMEKKRRKIKTTHS